MGYHIEIKHRILNFKQPARTSRGAYIIRDIWYMLLTSDEYPERWGVGECAPLPGLSCDLHGNFEQLLHETCNKLKREEHPDWESLQTYPSVCFALETAFRQFESGSFALWDTTFSRGEAGIPINGLIWMSERKKMIEQAEAKIKAGYRCIKLKIGALEWNDEIEVLKHLRTHYEDYNLEIRVDANGAFTPEEAMDKIVQLAEWGVHSIEQPIATGQWEEMSRLTAETPVPIALDEELIGWHTAEQKRKLLETIRPQYIILKPSLHGGVTGGNEWIAEAKRLQIDWWVTSALESNIGLNAIAQWCASLGTTIPQGLGTGALFTDNVEMPLCIQEDKLWYDPAGCTPDRDYFA